MESIVIASYTVRIRNTEDREDELLESFCGNNDLYTVLRDHLQLMKKTSSPDPSAKHVLRVKRVEANNRTLWGILESGQYGQASDILDVPKGLVVHNKTPTQADMIPFFYMFKVPTGSDEGILLLQRSGRFGVRKPLAAALRKLFEEEYPDCKIRISPLVPSDVIQKYLEGGLITKIRFVKFGLTDDIADSFEDGHKEVAGNMQLVASVRRGGSFPIRARIREFLDKKREIKSLFELKETKFDYDTIKLDVAVGGRKRTVNLGELRARAYYDLTDKVPRGVDGHPVYDKIKAASDELLRDIEKQLYGPEVAGE